MNTLTLTDFAKFFFSDIPLERIKEVLQENFPYAFHETNLCSEAPCLYRSAGACGLKVSLVFLNNVKAMLSKIKNILCDRVILRIPRVYRCLDKIFRGGLSRFYICHLLESNSFGPPRTFFRLLLSGVTCHKSFFIYFFFLTKW